ncbi:hypothetical protein ASD01_29710 [Ensifer sp. Root423]|uniref:helix-turn-helix transcriptional regulator n=1 Tax=Ensifer sp. Root423 TaxID=1736534 RepID=UPI000715929D|nr:AlpA family phage regulatory protein [Ensifer sp. Root423]KQX20992.1 hypothetical protein ASD01_29710 [Ensifer sp. Root423]
MKQQVITGRRLISIRDVCSLTSLSRSTLWLKVKAGDFPKPVKLSDDGVRKAFVSNEIDEWINQRISIRDREAVA